MKEQFDGRLDVEVYTLDSEEAQPYADDFKGSTNVLFNGEWVSLDIALEANRMEKFLRPLLE